MLMKPDRMSKCKLSINKDKYMQVDIKTESTILVRNHRYLKCAIFSNEIFEQTDFFIFKTKMLIFSIHTRCTNSNAVNWNTRRYE